VVWINYLVIGFWDRVSLCRPCWPPTLSLLASTSQVPRLQVCHQAQLNYLIFLSPKFLTYKKEIVIPNSDGCHQVRGQLSLDRQSINRSSPFSKYECPSPSSPSPPSWLTLLLNWCVVSWLWEFPWCYISHSAFMTENHSFYLIPSLSPGHEKLGVK
jgi:hypothetical protein